MKKIISLFLCFALLLTAGLSLVSCNDNDGADADPKEQDYVAALELLANCDYEGAKAMFESLGDYKNSEEYLSKFYYMPTSFEYDLIDKKGTNDVSYYSNNLPKSEITIRADAQAVSSFIYDENGNLIKQVMTKNTETEPEVYVYDYTYNSKGQRISAYYTAFDGFHVSYTFEYDENGRLTKQVYQDDSGADYRYTMVYDENGNMIRNEGLFNGESQVLNMVYTLDDNGRVIKEVCTYPNGYQETIDYEYDEHGNLVKETYTEGDGGQSVCDYEYDEHGNVIKETYTDEDGVVQYVKTEYILLYLPTGISHGTEAFLREFWGDRL